MVHMIQAIVTRQSIDKAIGAELGLPIFETDDATIIGLNDTVFTYWSKKIPLALVFHSNVTTDESCMTANNSITHYFADKLGLAEFAIVQTEYFGGEGSQSATVLRNGTQTMHATSDETSVGNVDIHQKPINAALKKIGVVAKGSFDEFSTVGLGEHRTYAQFFEGLDNK